MDAAVPANLPPGTELAGASVIVCGCGPSLNELPLPPPCLTIGVNDVGRRLDPDYLVVLNGPEQFTPDRWQHVANSRARAVFSQLPLPLRGAPLAPIRLGERGGVRWDDPRGLPFSRNSPYVALCLALRLGARRVGLIGVDFTEHHFFGATGVHPLARELDRIDAEYGRLAAAAAAAGIELFNLSPTSRLTTLPRLSVTAFASGAAPPAMSAAERPLRIVSYATTPVAGVPAILARCIAARTPHRARCVWATRHYGNGVSFDGDIEWTERPREAEAALAEADLVIVHNGKLDPAHAAVLRGKPSIVMAHNYLWNVDTALLREGHPGVVVGQYQATLPDFAGWGVVPNPIPLWEAAHQPGPKDATVTIAYTPSGRHESYPEGHRLYWHGKGYATTMRALDALSRRHALKILAVRDRQLSHAEALAAKRAAHVVIDECVTGSYHRNSLEGLAAGAVVVNGIGLRSGVTEVLRRCAGDAAAMPFVAATPATLEAVLDRLIASGSAALEDAGRRGRAWIEAHWDFRTQWERHWRGAVETALRRAASQRSHHAMPQAAAPVLLHAANPPAQPAASIPAQPAATHGLSVVVPFGGRARLPLLAATLAGLRQSPAVEQVIVVEAGEEEAALEVARRWDADHLRLAVAGPFDKARALNLGSRAARSPDILWCDGDLLFGDGFAERALAEFRARDLDFLFPFSRIDYLDETQSRGVRAGTLVPAACRPIRSLRPMAGGAVGGAGLVRADFLRRHGGLIEGFRGWGGEDNAWVHKARLCGRVGVTQHPGQVAWHLFHPDSGSTAEPWRDNPAYARNVELLRQVHAIRTPEELARRFPPAPPSPPWRESARLLLVAAGDGAAEAARSLAERLAACGIRAGLHSAAASGIDLSEADAVLVLAAEPAAAASLAAALAGRPAVLACLWEDEALPPPATWILARTAAQIRAWRAEGLRLWHRPSTPDAGGALPVAVQPLSQLLAPGQAALPAMAPEAAVALPVWTYWEGPMPEWIAQCLATMRRNLPGLRLLGPAEFAALRDRDLDLDLTRLHVAHRSDVIRALLLARYGGLWLDADCIVLRDLAPLLAHLATHEVIAHRERQGLFSNAFLAARPGSELAARFYATLCARLRDNRRLGWIALGNEPLTEVLGAAGPRCLELPTEAVQPVCWSRPEAYFHQAGEAEHARTFDPDAWCYMLSQQNLLRHARSTGAVLTAERSFFSYLLRRALAPAEVEAKAAPAQIGDQPGPPSARAAPFARMCVMHRSEGQESLSGPGSSLAQTAVVRRALPLLLQQLQARSLLDAPCGDFHWMADVALGVEEYIGVDILPELIAQNRARHAAPGRRFLLMDMLSDPLPRADAVLCRDALVHLPQAEVTQALGNFAASGARYLIATTFPNRASNPDIHLGAWRPLNLQAAPFSLPPPLLLLNEGCTESAGAFGDKSLGVWRLGDLR